MGGGDPPAVHFGQALRSRLAFFEVVAVFLPTVLR
jgi:hypothetical protein